MTIYLLQIMAFGALLFAIAVLSDKRQRKQRSSEAGAPMSVTLRDEEFASLTAIFQRSRTRETQPSPELNLPGKTTSK